MLANKHRPTRFADVCGQEEETKVLKKIITANWRPNAILFTGPFGTGKTTLARLTARAILCHRPKEAEPCGECESCQAMDGENHPNFLETDAASNSTVADVRRMKDETAYHTGSQTKVVYYDESHMLSHAAQNALLTTLEEGSRDTLFIFCTTEAGRMLPTLRSRCIELQVRLLSPGLLERRMRQVAEAEGIQHEGRALAITATYVRGHARDALILLEQFAKTANPITEQLVRSYLKLDRYVEAYKLLLEEDRREGFRLLEKLLHDFAPSELTDTLGEALLNTFKLSQGIETFGNFDDAWLRKILEKRDPLSVLDLAERILTTNTDFTTSNRALAVLGNALFGAKAEELRPARQAPLTVVPAQFRKPARSGA